jgi:hypothetical protein
MMFCILGAEIQYAIKNEEITFTIVVLF